MGKLWVMPLNIFTDHVICWGDQKKKGEIAFLRKT